MLASIFDQFVQMSPVTVMARGLMERIFAADRMDKLFATHAKVQYQRDLLFSSQVDLMSLVVCGIQKSVNAAYKAKAVELSISTTALYNKLNGVEIEVSQALVRETAQDLQQIVQTIGGEQPNPCPGYEMRIVDGNCLAGTDHRLDAIRLFAATALPGKMLVVLDPISKLVVDIFPIEDGHAQERSRFKEVLAVVKPNQIWTGDRNFCTAEFLTTIAECSAFFVIRQHGSLGWKEVSELTAAGQTETGDIFEQEIEICYQEKPLKCRRIVVKLFKPTRDKDSEIAILTNLSPLVADTALITHLYRNRWSVETLFQTVTENFNGEIQTLAYPRAALFSLAMAFATYNILATIRAALGSVHGVGKSGCALVGFPDGSAHQVEAGLSDYYLVDEVQGIYRGMMISIPDPHWQVFETFSIGQMGAMLQHLAHHVHLKRFLKATRGEKKKRPPLIVNSNHRHVSTARLLSTS
jgi:Transposase DDE domain